MRISRILGAVALAAVVARPGLSANDGRWIHVRVDEAGERGAQVDVQLPLSMVSAVLPTFKTRLDLKGEVDFGEDSISLAELRSYWAALKAAKDGQYVTVKDGDDDVRISKKAGVVHVDVSERRGAGRVKLRIPAPLVEAVLGDGDALDFDALAASLSSMPSGDLVTVDDDGDRVRIWIDDRPASPREDTP